MAFFNRLLTIEYLIQRISDAYSLAASAEERVDKADFTSRMPFFPDTPQIANGLARRFPPLNPTNLELTKVEEHWVRQFEADGDYRRQLMVEFEHEFSTLDNQHFAKYGSRNPR
jgi:hypothetical protein